MSNVDKYVWSENYLLSQKYTIDDINKYFHIDEEIINDVAESILIEDNTGKNKNKQCIYLIGQSGCGKSTILKGNDYSSYIVLDIDSYRALYPYKEEIIELIKANHMSNDLPDENSEGRDFTNFTRKFVEILTEKLFEECINNGYDVALQTQFTTYNFLENTFKKLKNLGYETKIFLPLVSSKISWERCVKRNAINNLSLNTVAKDFHDKSVSTLPDVIADIFKYYIANDNLISEIRIFKDEDVLVINGDSTIDYNELRNYIYENLK